MKKLIYLAFIPVIIMFCISCNFSIKGEGNIITKEIKLSNIKQISAKGNYRLIYLYDDKNPRMIIESYNNIINNLNIKNKDGLLSLSESKEVKDTDLYNIYIYNPEITQFNLYNNVNVDINSQIRTSKLTIFLYNNSKLLASNIVVDELNVKTENASKINLQGSGNKLKLNAKNDSDFSAPFFEISVADIQLANVATAELNIKSKLTGKIKNNTTLTLIGNPEKDLKQVDMAEIKQKQ